MKSVNLRKLMLLLLAAGLFQLGGCAITDVLGGLVGLLPAAI